MKLNVPHAEWSVGGYGPGNKVNDGDRKSLLADFEREKHLFEEVEVKKTGMSFSNVAYIQARGVLEASSLTSLTCKQVEVQIPDCISISAKEIEITSVKEKEGIYVTPDFEMNKRLTVIAGTPQKVAGFLCPKIEAYEAEKVAQEEERQRQEEERRAEQEREFEEHKQRLLEEIAEAISKLSKAREGITEASINDISGRFGTYYLPNSVHQILFPEEYYEDEE